jgi:hypothetical protein
MAEGVLLYFFGESIRTFLFQWFNWLSIVFVVLLIGGFWLVQHFGKKASHTPQENGES